MVALKEGIGPAIKALRKRRSLTQIELAERCRLSRGSIGQFERRLITPSLETLDRILEVLDADLRDVQLELDRQSGAEPEPSDEEFLEIAGLHLAPSEAERRLEAAFDRLVRRSLQSGKKAVMAPRAEVGVRDD